MRKMIMMLSALAAVVSAGAQNRSDRIAISAGALVERGLDATLSWEHETTYHNAWEFFANSYLQWDKCPVCETVCDESFFNNYNNWTAGFAWKPCILRFRNNYGSLRLGASAVLTRNGSLPDFMPVMSMTMHSGTGGVSSGQPERMSCFRTRAICSEPVSLWV